jgi:hypothetical protein
MGTPQTMGASIRKRGYPVISPKKNKKYIVKYTSISKKIPHSSPISSMFSLHFPIEKLHLHGHPSRLVALLPGLLSAAATGFGKSFGSHTEVIASIWKN